MLSKASLLASALTSMNFLACSVLGVREHRVAERGHPAIIQLDDAIRDVENAVVVGHQNDGDTLFLGETLHQIHRVATGLLVERRRGFVCEDDLRLPDQRPCDRDPLLLPAGKLFRVVTHPVTEAHRLEYFDGAPPHLALRKLFVERHAHLDVLYGVQ